MRVLLEPRLGLGDAHLLEERQRPRAGLRAGDAVVEEQHLLDLLADGVDRVERAHRLLEDHRDLAAAERAHPRLRQREQILPVEDDLGLLGDLRPLGQEPHHRASGHRLARPALADDGDGLAAVDLEVHRAHRLDGAALDLEGDAHLARVEQHLAAVAAEVEPLLGAEAGDRGRGVAFHRGPLSTGRSRRAARRRAR